MKQIRTVAISLYKHHFVRYLIVGGSTFVIDFSILFSLHSEAKLNLALSTSISYWISVLYNFSLTRYWTFDARQKESLKRHITAYLAVLIFNFLFTLAVVTGLDHHINYVIAKALAVIISIPWTYTIYKKYVFIQGEPQESTILGKVFARMVIRDE
jgi:putative flippase GtrA